MSGQTGNFDIVIVGGGLAGASLALALANSRYSVAVLEAVAPDAGHQPSYDDRTLAVALTSCRILQTLGVMDILRKSATAIRSIHVSELGRGIEVDLDARQLGFESFGEIIEARAIGVALLTKLDGAENIQRFCPARLSDLQTTESGVRLVCEQDAGELSLNARLVVAADGARSNVREMLAIPSRVHDYRQTAVIANVTPEKAHRNRAFERFTKSGPLAILPHVGNRCGVVWSVPRGEEQNLLERADDDFLGGLNRRVSRHTREHLGEFVKVGKRSAYPLYLVRPQTSLAERVVLIGNAAHAIHPNSAQGFNLALRDAASLAEVLLETSTPDPGDQELLTEYQRWRQPDQEQTIRYSDTLARLFANPGWLAATLRGGGMVLHQIFPPLKRRLVLSAMGFRGRLPQLARGHFPGKEAV